MNIEQHLEQELQARDLTAQRITAKRETAVAAALAAARNGSGRGEVFALVPVGKAVRGAEWRPS